MTRRSDDPIVSQTQEAVLSRVVIADEKGSTQPEGLHRGLGQRQLTMMAIGGAIGVGLFLGSSATVRLAGPAVILS